MVDPSTFFNNNCLLSIKTAMWQAKKKLAQQILETIGPAEWLSGTQKIAAGESGKLITQPRKIIAKAKKDIKNISTPFPIDGVTLLLHEHVETASKILENAKAEFDATVQVISARFDEIKAEAYEILAPRGLYDESDYPMDITKKYSMEWQYFTMDTPKFQGVGAEILTREQQKLLATIEQAKQTCQDILLDELNKLVGHMVERLGYSEDGRPKRFHETLVSNFVEFFENLPARNVFGSEKIKAVAQEAQDILRGVTADSLKHSSAKRNEIKTKMEAFHATLGSYIGDAPIRSIVLPHSEKAA